MKFFADGKISIASDTGEKGKTLEGKDYEKKVAYLSNYRGSSINMNLNEERLRIRLRHWEILIGKTL